MCIVVLQRKHTWPQAQYDVSPYTSHWRNEKLGNDTRFHRRDWPQFFKITAASCRAWGSCCKDGRVSSPSRQLGAAQERGPGEGGYSRPPILLSLPSRAGSVYTPQTRTGSVTCIDQKNSADVDLRLPEAPQPPALFSHCQDHSVKTARLHAWEARGHREREGSLCPQPCRPRPDQPHDQCTESSEITNHVS